MPNIEETYRVLRSLDPEKNLTQRSLAEDLGYSLGKVNYVLKALVDKGLVKADNFLNNSNKWSYRYILTPHGLKEKARITKEFLTRKEAEYEALQVEIERLRVEVEES